MHNSANRWLTIVLLTLFVAIIAYGARGAAHAPGNSPPQNVIVVNGAGQAVPTAIQGTPDVNVANLPAVQVSSLPAVQVSSLPAVQVSSLPAVQLSGGTSVAVSSLPAVQLAGGQSIGTNSYGDNHPFTLGGSLTLMGDGSTSTDSGVLTTVPPGQILIIDSIDVESDSDNGGNYATLMTLYYSSLTARVALKPVDGFSTKAVGSQLVHLTFAAGQDIHVLAERADGRQSGVVRNFVTLCGHYVPAP